MVMKMDITGEAVSPPPKKSNLKFRANTRFAPTKCSREEVGVNLVFTRSLETASGIVTETKSFQSTEPFTQNTGGKSDD